MGPADNLDGRRVSRRPYDRSVRLVSVNVGRPQQVSVRRGRPLMSAIGKRPVDGRVRVAGVNVEGDDQADRRVHGGPDKAVYAYAAEDAAWWAEELGREIPPGMFGENLTLEGVDVSGALVGQRWTIGTAELEVCQPRLPCAKLGLRFGDPLMVRRFAEARRPGAYLRIVREGELGAGDEVHAGAPPAHGVTVRLVSEAILLDEGLLAAAAAAPELPPELARWMLERAA
jgi:MOSC domain-containing protein YiiM